MALRPVPAVSLLALTAALAPAQVQPNLPTGFVDEVVAPIVGAMDLDFLPDGRAVVIDQLGGVWVVPRVGASVPQTGAQIATVPNLAISYSRGLLAVAVDPAWPHRPFLYLWHNDAPSQSMRITRWTASGTLTGPASTSLQLGAPYVVLEIADADPQHNGGFLSYDGSGLLYLSTGDDQRPCEAQDPASPNGKVLRLDVAGLPRTGTGPATTAQIAPPNPPFPQHPLAWTLGVRNPFRGHTDPVVPGRLLLADVGDAGFDELDVLEAPGGGENLGWPWFEANQPLFTCTGTAPQQTAPVLTVPLPVGGFGALTSLGFYRNRAAAGWNFGPAYEGSALAVDHFAGDVYRLVEQAGAWVTAPAVSGQPHPTFWATGLSWAVASRVGPDGALYWIERRSPTTGALHRIRPSTPQSGFGYLGAGCTTSTLRAAAPRVGQPWQLTLDGLTVPASYASLVIGYDAVQGPLGPLPEDLTPFGVEGCWLRLDPADTLAMQSGAGGTWTWNATIPNSAALVGLGFYVQGLVLAPAAGTSTGFALTAAAGGRIGA